MLTSGLLNYAPTPLTTTCGRMVACKPFDPKYIDNKKAQGLAFGTWKTKLVPLTVVFGTQPIEGLPTLRAGDIVYVRASDAAAQWATEKLTIAKENPSESGDELILVPLDRVCVVMSGCAATNYDFLPPHKDYKFEPYWPQETKYYTIRGNGPHIIPPYDPGQIVCEVPNPTVAPFVNPTDIYPNQPTCTIGSNKTTE